MSQAVDYVQMDVCCQGGYALGRRLFAEVARQGLSFAFHSWGTALEVLAAAHLGICWPQIVAEWLEYPIYAARDGGAGHVPVPAGVGDSEGPARDRTRRSHRAAHARPRRRPSMRA